VNTLPPVWIVALHFKITFHDADDGDCYAGDGQKIVRVCSSKERAESLIREWNPILSAAEKETTVFPVQQHNRRIKKEFGFTLDNLNDGYDFHLAYEEWEVEADNPAEDADFRERHAAGDPTAIAEGEQ